MEFVRHLVAKGFIGEEAVQIVQSKRDPQPMKLVCGLLDLVKDHLGVMTLQFEVYPILTDLSTLGCVLGAVSWFVSANHNLSRTSLGTCTNIESQVVCDVITASSAFKQSFLLSGIKIIETVADCRNRL